MPRAAAVVTEPLWMRTLRGKARERFQDMRWPTTAEEEWRRTDLSRVPLDSFMPVTRPVASRPSETDPGTASGLLRFDSARCRELSLAPELREAGVRLLPLDHALEEFEAPLHSLYENALAGADNRFLAWHYAEWSHGALLWIPAGLEIKEPFFIDLQESGEGQMSAPHLAVLLGVGSRATVIQRISAPGGASALRAGLLCNSVMDIRLADAAALQIWEQQELAPEDISVRHVMAEVGRDASLRHFDAELGSRLAKSRVECALDGAGAEAFLDGAYYCGRGQHMDLRTVQRHRSPKAMSRAVYKGAVAGGGRTVFQGLIEVSAGAAGTDAWLTNRNLILGEAARADSMPTLKIGNNDVKCSHGSTTGRLNAEEVFYLQSRGLSAADAREMLVIGYFEDILTTAPETFRESTLGTIRDRLRAA